MYFMTKKSDKANNVAQKLRENLLRRQKQNEVIAKENLKNDEIKRKTRESSPKSVKFKG